MSEQNLSWWIGKSREDFAREVAARQESIKAGRFGASDKLATGPNTVTARKASERIGPWPTRTRI